jgi:hypothetical protein
VPVLDFVAGNGLINRRALLGNGITIAGGLTAAGTVTAAAEPLTDAPWSLAVGETLPAVQTPSAFEKDVTRALIPTANSAPRMRARRISGWAARSRRTACTFRSIMAAFPTSIRPRTSLSSMAWCASRLNSRWSRCRAIRW